MRIGNDGLPITGLTARTLGARAEIDILSTLTVQCDPIPAECLSVLFSAVHGWMLVSERVRQALERCGVEGVQFLPVRVMHKATGAEIGSYSALNVVRVVEALDWERTRWLTADRKVVDDHPILAIVRVALRREAVSGVDIFRLRVKHDVGEIFISPRVKQCLERAGATSGFRFIPVPVY
ncbi:DUF1629 domain-containing protein [Roseiflexus sp.]|uniref:imm11 family protein n=1 Tax=Roseiflexus sp. TaxID=2562120 RepID=UPI003458B0E1